MGLFKSNKIIGLDIGTTSIKLAELNVSRNKAKLVSFGFAPTPPGAVDRGEIQDTNSVAEAIQQLISEVRTKRTNVATSVWGTAVIVKKITIPRMEENILDEQIKFEAEQYIPFDIDDINIEYHILRHVTQNMETMDVLLIAAQKGFIFRYAETVEASGLHASVLDVSGFALANCFQFNYGDTPGEVVALLNIGAGVANFVVIDNGDVVFSRDIPVGGLTYTNDIHKQMGVSIDEAESLKLSASAGTPVPDEVTSAINTTNETVVEEIQRSLDFYTATTADGTIHRMFMTGGSSPIPNLHATLKGNLGFEVQNLNPFQTMDFDSRAFSSDYISQIAPFASVALGLALRAQGDR